MLSASRRSASPVPRLQEPCACARACRQRRVALTHAARSAYMEAEVGACDPQRPVYLLGESFGALLALAVAAQRPDLVDRLVLANPATAFPRSLWARLGPLLPRVPPVPPRPPAPLPRRASSARHRAVRRRRACARPDALRRAGAVPGGAARARARAGQPHPAGCVRRGRLRAAGAAGALAALSCAGTLRAAQAPAGACPSGAVGARAPSQCECAGPAGGRVRRGRGGAAAAAADACQGAAAADARMEAAADRGRRQVRPRPTCGSDVGAACGILLAGRGKPHALRAPSAAVPSRCGRSGSLCGRRARASRRGARARAGRWRASCAACRRARWCWSPTATCSSPRARRARTCRSCCRAACSGCRPPRRSRLLKCAERPLQALASSARPLCARGPRGERVAAAQVMRGHTHALLQEAGMNLVAVMEEEGFYVRRRMMSAPLARRGRASFGAAAPIELPTPREMERFAEGCAAWPPRSRARGSCGRDAPPCPPRSTRARPCAGAHARPAAQAAGHAEEAGQPGLLLHRGRRHGAGAPRPLRGPAPGHGPRWALCAVHAGPTAPRNRSV